MTYIYGPRANDSFGVDFVLELRPFLTLTLIFKGHGQGQGQMSGVIVEREA